ncbi:MAG: cytidine deaminase [Chitinophagales bacterium]
MQEKEISFRLQIFSNESELEPKDANVLKTARNFLPNSYAPYSNFQVAAAIELSNGEIVCGANQENAAYPMCVCAEVTALSAATSKFPGIAPAKMAVVINSLNKISDQPAAPCGQCRQTIFEYEKRFGKKIEIIMAAAQGPIYKVSSIGELLPLHFSGSDL